MLGFYHLLFLLSRRHIKQSFKCKVAKLFSKHMKVKDQQALLQSGAFFPVAVGEIAIYLLKISKQLLCVFVYMMHILRSAGTPNRLNKLAEIGALSLADTDVVIIDCARWDLVLLLSTRNRWPWQRCVIDLAFALGLTFLERQRMPEHETTKATRTALDELVLLFTSFLLFCFAMVSGMSRNIASWNWRTLPRT